MEYISQQELIEAAQQGWDVYADALGLEMGGIIAFRKDNQWNYLVHDTDSPTGSRQTLEQAWVYLNENGNNATNSFENVPGTSVTRTYDCKSGGNNFAGFRMETSIEGAQKAWRSLDFIQGTTGSNAQYDVYPPTKINFAVFDDPALGAAYAEAMYNFLEDPTPENEEEMRAALAPSLNPGKKKDPKFGPKSEPGGYGPESPVPGGGSGGPGPTFDGTSDPWTPTPTKPGVLSFGLLNIYKCDTGALINLGQDLFPEITWPSPSSVTDLLEWVGDVIIKFSDSIWNKGLIDYIVSVHLIPVDVTAGALTDIKIGPRTMTGILARPISADVIEFDCGSVHIDEYYTNYVDYMTRCRVYLPYYGWVEIKPEYWQSADISIKYLWNVVDGSFVAQIFSTITRHQSPCTVLVGQYSGNACVHLPLSGANYASMFSQLAGAAGGLAAGIASGNVAVTASSAMNIAGNNGQMQQSNAYNASSAFYGHSRPFLLIERPISHFSDNYVTEKGLPLLTKQTIGSCSGFTVAEDIILDGIPCTAAEKERIRNYFKSGVIIR